jgi:hypothetical protein
VNSLGPPADAGMTGVFGFGIGVTGSGGADGGIDDSTCGGAGAGACQLGAGGAAPPDTGGAANIGGAGNAGGTGGC